MIIAILVLMAVIGAQAYFVGEQSKPLHERTGYSESFEQLASAFTGRETAHAVRIPVYSGNAYSSRRTLPKA